MKKIFLDDERQCYEDGFIIVRDYDAFKAEVATGFPDFVSFDHDLGTGLSGFDCAKHLVDVAISLGGFPQGFDYRVHSMNPVGKANIISYMTSAIRNVGFKE